MLVSLLGLVISKEITRAALVGFGAAAEDCALGAAVHATPAMDSVDIGESAPTSQSSDGAAVARDES
ncbi:hypothetical protein Airi02_069050 [Actinoallomurus iriomotensis]|uniref:Uncharacterized protein n=1 Tax=Actinoallomurus iriomotensis TaxID=478107 RepID=A0A9W6S5F5_9ACTN|nr:hypothetical protein Airi02_069050 [Actinoallomurus iriomotensis]